MLSPRFLTWLPPVATLYSKARGRREDRRDQQRLKEADVALVSFPKSGRTFVRVMLARLFRNEHGIDERHVLKFKALAEAAPQVPRLLFTHDGDAMRRPAEIRVNPQLYAGKRLCLLVRHPGDVVVSRYHHVKYRSHDPARQLLGRQPLEKFVWTEQGGVESIVEFMNQWATLARSRGDIHVVRYEDFLSTPEGTLKPLARFIGLAASDADVADAVEFARFENLRTGEREGYFQSDRMGPGREGGEQSFKVRSGKSGGYRGALNEAEQSRIDSYLQNHLDPMFGYSR